MVQCVIAVVLLAMSACYQPDVESCTYACASGANPCPSGMSCVGTRCVHKGDTCGDDAGGSTNFFDLRWGDPNPVPGLVDANRCERRPVLDPSRTYLVLARPTGNVVTMTDCISTSALELYEWRNGAPVKVGTPPQFEPSPLVIPTFIGDGAGAGFTGGHQFFVYRTDVGAATILLKKAEVSSDLRTLIGTTATLSGFPANTEVTFDATLKHIVYASNNELFEGTGTPSTAYVGTLIDQLSTTEAEVTPTMTPDGRVLVFVRSTGGSAGQTDLYVSRRTEITEPWGPPQMLPVGQFKINSDNGYEYDPSITSDGDLLFTSTRAGDGTRRRVFLARHL